MLPPVGSLVFPMKGHKKGRVTGAIGKNLNWALQSYAVEEEGKIGSYKWTRIRYTLSHGSHLADEDEGEEDEEGPAFLALAFLSLTSFFG